MARQHDRRRFDSPLRLSRLHRIGAALLGLLLITFGILGLVDRLDLFSTSGRPLLGLSTNGLLSGISLVVGGILIAAAVRGGRLASTVMVVVGGAFMLSGVLNALVIGTSFNILAFGIPNIVFSLIVGGLLLIMGAYGRFTGRLPKDNPYQQERHPDEVADVLPTIYGSAAEVQAVTELAEAERAVARHAGTQEQQEGVTAADRFRRAEDRVAGWHGDSQPVDRGAPPKPE